MDRALLEAMSNQSHFDDSKLNHSALNVLLNDIAASSHIQWRCMDRALLEAMSNQSHFDDSKLIK
jgi:hypothetical protein